MGSVVLTRMAKDYLDNYVILDEFHIASQYQDKIQVLSLDIRKEPRMKLSG